MEPILRRGQTLIGLLVVVAIGLVLMAYYLGPTKDKNGKEQHSVAKRAIDRSQEVALNSNINQINQFIFMYKNDNDGQVPASMDDLKKAAKGFPPEMFINPVDQQPLNYDPKTGRVWATPYDDEGKLGRMQPQMPGMTTPEIPSTSP
jgi:type II secretory pathway pseudopilin PulG